MCLKTHAPIPHNDSRTGTDLKQAATRASNPSVQKNIDFLEVYSFNALMKNQNTRLLLLTLLLMNP